MPLMYNVKIDNFIFFSHASSFSLFKEFGKIKK